MYDGVKAMIEAEKDLGGGFAPVEEEKDIVCGPHLKKKEDITGFPVFKEGEQGSLLYKFLTRDVWNQLKD